MSNYFDTVRPHVPSRHRNDGFVSEANRIANTAIDDFFHAVRIAHGGSNDIAVQLRDRYADQIRSIAINLTIVNRAEDTDEAGAALRALVSDLEGMGYTGGDAGLHGWLAKTFPQSERNDAILDAARFDRVRIRRDHGTPLSELEALTALLREQVELFRTHIQFMEDERLRGAEPDAEAAAREVTGAGARALPTGGDVAPTGTFRPGDLAPELVGATR